MFADFGARRQETVDTGDARTHSTQDGSVLATTEDAVPPGPGASEVSNPMPRRRRTRWNQIAWDRLSAIENFWETLDEIEVGMVAQLAKLAGERRWEVIFLTSRPDTKGAAVQVQSQRWLEAKGFALPSVFVTTASRGRIAAALALDLVVDDTPENCLDVATESEARAILVCRGRMGHLPASARRLGIGSVSSMSECLSVIDEADRVKRGGEVPGGIPPTPEDRRQRGRRLLI